ncbi:MAG: hypothetical protein WCS30_11465, partial [Selenomonadaceae bacterium]
FTGKTLPSPKSTISPQNHILLLNLYKNIYKSLYREPTVYLKALAIYYIISTKKCPFSRCLSGIQDI